MGIGSPQFVEDDSVGLTEDLSSEEEVGSEGEETEYSTDDSDAPSTKKAPAKRRTTFDESETDDSESDEDMFAVKKQGKSISDDESEDETDSEDSGGKKP